jgi:hypothetical protein
MRGEAVLYYKSIKKYIRDEKKKNGVFLGYAFFHRENSRLGFLGTGEGACRELKGVLRRQKRAFLPFLVRRKALTAGTV